ncbi:hypothetical protein M427DRAFT_272824 [Gonapodya prolifera JEL478]|uniref:Uncharacterized protein n=1 Tax=Gonapodya prolifera (strain JEL478) TaxID=1344416 RepID=A0A139AXR8_GONPJ|nr:hypothetical protein M427DRAFT_272824 [Gonapodya prolifera JEL478]|eukprot:KXS21536.1 hypothetical protein M427DRAFT_272824 [Gonapodya prolifera JEL478]
MRRTQIKCCSPIRQECTPGTLWPRCREGTRTSLVATIRSNRYNTVQHLLFKPKENSLSVHDSSMGTPSVGIAGGIAVEFIGWLCHGGGRLGRLGPMGTVRPDGVGRGRRGRRSRDSRRRKNRRRRCGCGKWGRSKSKSGPSSRCVCAREDSGSLLARADGDLRSGVEEVLAGRLGATEFC